VDNSNSRQSAAHSYRQSEAFKPFYWQYGYSKSSTIS